jgi:hypothetical protein
LAQDGALELVAQEVHVDVVPVTAVEESALAYAFCPAMFRTSTVMIGRAPFMGISLLGRAPCRSSKDRQPVLKT